MARAERPLPPAPEPDARCIFELRPSTAWRWFPAGSCWERVCHRHRPSATAIANGDYVPDAATTERRDP